MEKIGWYSAFKCRREQMVGDWHYIALYEFGISFQQIVRVGYLMKKCLNAPLLSAAD